MNGVTLDRATYQRMLQAWSSFGPEWREARRACAESGYPFPPAGSAVDDRDDPEPSQRAIVWRSLDYRRDRTLELIRRSKSWPEVVGRILGDEGRLREDAALRERDDDWDRKDEPTGRQALQTIATLLDRIKESV